jgi:hypothetical protein
MWGFKLLLWSEKFGLEREIVGIIGLEREVVF